MAFALVFGGKRLIVILNYAKIIKNKPKKQIKNFEVYYYVYDEIRFL